MNPVRWKRLSKPWGRWVTQRAVPVLQKHGAGWPLRVRLTMTVALGRIGGAQAEAALWEMAQFDPSPSVRRSAEKTLNP
jgi:hypothetical protein